MKIPTTEEKSGKLYLKYHQVCMLSVVFIKELNFVLFQLPLCDPGVCVGSHLLYSVCSPVCPARRVCSDVLQGQPSSRDC